MSKQDEQRLLVKIATLYYSEGMKQAEIAESLHLSQSFVSRARADNGQLSALSSAACSLSSSRFNDSGPHQR
ncbi:hypothetical protein Bresa_02092|uniref:Uncharacterized protein n=1 Tax=Brenneria salicis ATCC 15712 = DSM 30166 TaxID=714314 RepID=A0A366HZ25_9GAMM|nr:hypothetical protein [Brenneria salicis ATCC 15712 = DSM 30166]RBP58326.1 hypothetical protein DES54_15110 [Brenneria salicis ATCC 15712 = DSM 30166]